jgi:hypothetical protein
LVLPIANREVEPLFEFNQWLAGEWFGSPTLAMGNK